jgi:tetratricopeptide (TPR) repeat protein
LIMLQRKQKDWKSSVQTLLTIAERYERDADKTKAGDVYADIAQICLENDELDESWAYAEKARMSLPDPHPLMGKVHRVLAFVYFRRNDGEKGRKHLDNAIKIFEQHGKVAELEEATLHMCRYLSETGDHKKAFERMEQLHHHLMKKLEQRGIVL